MADVALVFQGNRTLLDSLELTATLSESHNRQADVTEHPMETGSDAADHVRSKPTSLKLEGIVSESAGLSAGDVYSQLEAILDAGNPITIVTALRQYENMVMTSLDVPRENKVAGALKFSCAFKSIRLVQTQTVRINTKQPRVKPNEDGAKKVGDVADASTERRSQLKGAADNFGLTKPGSGVNKDAPFKFVQR